MIPHHWIRSIAMSSEKGGKEKKFGLESNFSACNCDDDDAWGVAHSGTTVVIVGFATGCDV